MYSGERPMFLTRAQAEDIATFFDQEYLQGLVTGDVKPFVDERSGLRRLLPQ
jgi:hypothetical protein